MLDPFTAPPLYPMRRLECVECGSHVLVRADLRVGAGGQCPTCYSYELKPAR